MATFRQCRGKIEGKKNEARKGKVRKRSGKQEAWVRGKWMRQKETRECEDMGGWKQRKQDTEMKFVSYSISTCIITSFVLPSRTGTSTSTAAAVFSPVTDGEQIPSDSMRLTGFCMFGFSTGDAVALVVSALPAPSIKSRCRLCLS